MEKVRRCIGCMETKNRENLIKITKDFKTDEIIYNPKNTDFGRSVYICKNLECIDSALKKNKLSKALKKNLSKNEKENIKTVLNAMVVVKH